MVAVALVVFVFVLLGQRQGSAPAATPAETDQVVSAVTQMPASVADAVGSGGLPNPLKPVSAATPLTGAAGKPQVLYIGAEYCPYCTGERWSLVQALSRFGTFSNLELTTSSSTDVDPNTPTFTFLHSQYSSQYVDFAAVETENREQQPLRSPSPAQQRLLAQYDPPGSIPFIDVGNRYVATGSGFTVDPLAGKSWQDIAGQLQDASSPITRAIVGNANYLAAAICRTTNGQPGSVCNAAGVQQAVGRLG